MSDFVTSKTERIQDNELKSNFGLKDLGKALLTGGVSIPKQLKDEKAKRDLEKQQIAEIIYKQRLSNEDLEKAHAALALSEDKIETLQEKVESNVTTNQAMKTDDSSNNIGLYIGAFAFLLVSGGVIWYMIKK